MGWTEPIITPTMVRSDAGQLSGSPSLEDCQHRSRSRRPQSPPPARNVADSKRRSSPRAAPTIARLARPSAIRANGACLRVDDVWSSLMRNLLIATSKRAREGNCDRRADEIRAENGKNLWRSPSGSLDSPANYSQDLYAAGEDRMDVRYRT